MRAWESPRTRQCAVPGRIAPVADRTARTVRETPLDVDDVGRAVAAAAVPASRHRRGHPLRRRRSPRHSPGRRPLGNPLVETVRGVGRGAEPRSAACRWVSDPKPARSPHHGRNGAGPQDERGSSRSSRAARAAAGSRTASTLRGSAETLRRSARGSRPAAGRGRRSPGRSPAPASARDTGSRKIPDQAHRAPVEDDPHAASRSRGVPRPR